MVNVQVETFGTRRDLLPITASIRVFHQLPMLLCSVDMEDKILNNDNFPFIRELCADLDEKELQEAEATFRGYIETVFRIHERIRREKDASRVFDSNKAGL